MDFAKSHTLNPNDPNALLGLFTTGLHLKKDRTLLDDYFKQIIKIEALHFRAHMQQMISLHPNWGGNWKKMDSFEKTCKRRSKRFPMLKYVIRASQASMTKRSEEHRKSLRGSDKLWAMIAKEQLEQNPDLLYLQIQFIMLSNGEWELRDEATAVIQQVGNRHPEDIWHFDIGDYTSTYNLSLRHRAHVRNLEYRIHVATYGDSNDLIKELHEQVIAKESSFRSNNAYAQFLTKIGEKEKAQKYAQIAEELKPE